VTGFACSIPVRGKHIFEPSRQMHNRGNGRGGGIAAMGFDPRMLGVSPEILEEDYILQIAVLEEGVMGTFIVNLSSRGSTSTSRKRSPHRRLPRHQRPGGSAPDVWRYFVRVKPEVLNSFISRNGFEGLSQRKAEDEFVYQNTFRLNKAYYDAFGKQKALSFPTEEISSS